MIANTPLTPELRELLRVLLVHPEVLEATIMTKDGRHFSVVYPNDDADERVCREHFEI
jgi:hypothetical protein